MDTYLSLPSSSTKTSYKGIDVYDGLRRILMPDVEKTAVDFSPDPHLMMSPQQAGTCAWRSLMAFLRTKMEINDYKRLKCDIKLQSLLDWVQAKKNVEQNPRLIKKSHQKLCRNIVNLYRKKLIGDEYIQGAIEVLKPVSEWLHKNSNYYSKRPSKSVSYNYSTPWNSNTIENKHSLNGTLDSMRKNGSTIGTSMQPCDYTLESFKGIKANCPSQITADLDQAKNLANDAWTKGYDLPNYKGLLDFISRIPLQDDFWKQ